MPSVNLKCGWTICHTGRSHRMVKPRRWVSLGGGKFFLLTGKFRLHLTWFPNKGIAYTACDRKRPERGPGFYPHWERETTWMKKKKLQVAEQAPVHSAAIESVLFSTVHSIVAHCATTRYEDGDPRQPGWITITSQGSTWKVTVKDPDAAASFVVIAPTIDEALGMAALLLDSDDAPWAHDKWLAKGQKKKG